jgi:hypothetical protein
MALDFRAIRLRLQRQLEIRRLRATLVLLRFLQAVTSRLSATELQKQFDAEQKAQHEKFDAERKAINQQAADQFRSLHRHALFSSVGLALSQWAGMEDLLVGIASLLLRTHVFYKLQPLARHYRRPVLARASVHFTKAKMEQIEWQTKRPQGDAR